uniref:Uncharacterized protein n=1 Tax=Desertifilum tharense IPPAS B-1220 TaxID=1781255 RepID=A0ACD5GSP7_9CYAN
MGVGEEGSWELGVGGWGGRGMGRWELGEEIGKFDNYQLRTLLRGS